MTIASAAGLQSDIDGYKMDTKACNYFTFAEQGVAVDRHASFQPPPLSIIWDFLL
jgi:hypothetical protein